MSQLSSNVCKTLRHYNQSAVRTGRAMWWGLSRRALVRPIFVVGCSRAGTTLVYKTISQSKEIGSLQRETHDFWVALHPLEERNWSTHALGVADANPRDRDIVSRHFFSYTGKRRVVDKNNQNGLCVPYLHALFPDAHFVDIRSEVQATTFIH